VNSVNVSGTLNVLVAARDAGSEKGGLRGFVVCVRRHADLAKVETMRPNPLSLMQSPSCRRAVTAAFQRGLPPANRRIEVFQCLRPRQSPDSEYAAVIPKFIKALRNGQPPVIFGDGSRRGISRSSRMLWMDDTGCRIGTANGKPSTSQGQEDNPQRTCQDIGELTVGRHRATHADPRAGDVRHSLADITLRGNLRVRAVPFDDEGLALVVSSMAGWCN